MSLVIAIANQKGGVGKTTTTFYLLRLLAEQGRTVLGIDLDPQGNLTKLSGVHAGGRHIGHVLGGSVAPSANLRSACVDSPHGYQVVPSSIDVANTASGLLMRAMSSYGMNQDHLYALRNAVCGEGHRWDAILVDCPPDPGILTINALIAAQLVIVPVQPEDLALDGMAQMHAILADVAEATGGAPAVRLVATQVDGRSLRHRSGLARLQDEGVTITIPRRDGADNDDALCLAYTPLANLLTQED